MHADLLTIMVPFVFLISRAQGALKDGDVMIVRRSLGVIPKSAGAVHL